MNNTYYWILGLGVLFVALDSAFGLPGDIDTFVQQLANAIALAEGFYVTGSRPQVDNNPGSLTTDITGTGVGTDGNLVVYASVTDGWNALYQLCSNILYGGSSLYNSGMTITQLASTYTGGDNPSSWAATVAQSLGVSVNTTLASIIGA